MIPKSGCFMLAGLLILPAAFALAEEDASRAARRPTIFPIIFNYGYGGDHFPADAETFEKVLVGAKSANFNTILCSYTNGRGEVCKKHGMKIFVDLLAPANHVYKNEQACRELCENLRNNDVVFGYHLWSDNIGSTYPGRSRDVKNVQTWDPTHPTYVGCYQMSRISRVENLDLLGYYDFQWKRGGHWGHLSQAMSTAKEKDAYFLRYCDASPGQVGKGNVNRAGWTIATSIPFGLKGYLYHYGGGVVNKETGELDLLGQDLQKVNGGILPLTAQLLSIGNPLAVFSTTVTKTNKDRPTGSDAPILPELPGIPSENWFSVSSGEVVLGLFQDPQGRRVVVAASHNAYQDQAVTLKLAADQAQSAAWFSPQKKEWLPMELTGGEVKFNVGAYAPALVRFD